MHFDANQTTCELLESADEVTDFGLLLAGDVKPADALRQLSRWARAGRLYQCRMWVIRDAEFNYVHFNGLPAILYDLQKDAHEWHNVAADPAYRDVVERYRLKLLEWRMSTEDNTYCGWAYERRPHFGMNPFRIRPPWPPYY